MALDHHEAGAA